MRTINIDNMLIIGEISYSVLIGKGAFNQPYGITMVDILNGNYFFTFNECKYKSLADAIIANDFKFVNKIAYNHICRYAQNIQLKRSGYETTSQKDKDYHCFLLAESKEHAKIIIENYNKFFAICKKHGIMSYSNDKLISCSLFGLMVPVPNVTFFDKFRKPKKMKVC